MEHATHQSVLQHSTSALPPLRKRKRGSDNQTMPCTKALHENARNLQEELTYDHKRATKLRRDQCTPLYSTGTSSVLFTQSSDILDHLAMQRYPFGYRAISDATFFKHDVPLGPSGISPPTSATCDVVRHVLNPSKQDLSVMLHMSTLTQNEHNLLAGFMPPSSIPEEATLSSMTTGQIVRADSMACISTPGADIEREVETPSSQPILDLEEFLELSDRESTADSSGPPLLPDAGLSDAAVGTYQ